MAGLNDILYMKSPIWLQQAAVALWGVAWFKRRFGPLFHEYVQEFRYRENWTIDQFRKYQTDKLAQVLKSAWESPYYREVFASRGVTQDMDPWDALAHMPLLTKQTLRTHARSLITQHPLPRGTTVFKSSGTTGTPTEIYFTPEFHALNTAIGEVRSLNVGGTSYRDRRVMFGVRKVCRFDQDKPPFWRYSPIENMAYASIYHLSPRFLPLYMEFFRRYRPAIVMGYPSALYTIARYAIDHNDFPAPAKMIITTSETVYPTARAVMEAAWKCKLYDRYGAVEGCLFVAQCEQGRYHVSPDMGVIEILDSDGRPCPLGDLGEVVCTGLHNTLQPLIRYRIGDAARWAKNQRCECKRHTPIIEAIEGRIEDICYTADGRQMLRFDTVFKGVENIKEAQVVQEALNQFIIYVVPTVRFSEHDIELIKHNMYLHVGEVEICVQPVHEIQRSSSGKFRAVLCKLAPQMRPSH